MNAQVRDNGLLGPEALATADGEMWIATGANAGEMVSVMTAANLLKLEYGGLELDISNVSINDGFYGDGPGTTILIAQMSQALVEAGTDTRSRPVSALRIKQAIDNSLPVPPGVIVMWSGTIAAIPAGWLICDGNSGTPNLLAKFIQGVATAATNPGATGGAATVTLTGAESGTEAHSHGVTDGGHTHLRFGSATAVPGSGVGYEDLAISGNLNLNTSSETTGISIDNVSASSASSAHENEPAFFDLAFLYRS